MIYKWNSQFSLQIFGPQYIHSSPKS